MAGCVSAFFWIVAVVALCDMAASPAEGGGKLAPGVAIASLLLAAGVHAVLGLLVSIAQSAREQAKAIEDLVGELRQRDYEQDAG